MGGGWWWVMGAGWLIVLAVIVALVVVLTRQHGEPRTRHGAHDVLDERFARGEIDDDEYHRRRDALRG